MNGECKICLERCNLITHQCRGFPIIHPVGVMVDEMPPLSVEYEKVQRNLGVALELLAEARGIIEDFVDVYDEDETHDFIMWNKRYWELVNNNKEN